MLWLPGGRAPALDEPEWREQTPIDQRRERDDICLVEGRILVDTHEHIHHAPVAGDTSHRACTAIHVQQFHVRSQHTATDISVSGRVTGPLSTRWGTVFVSPSA